MSQQVPETRDSSVGQWLPLTEYSVRSGVSLSTIRRKIKSNAIPFKLEKGKYLILFAGTESTPLVEVEAPRTAAPVSQNWDGYQNQIPTGKAEARPHRESPHENQNGIKMVTDAFEHALREKDNHIHMLEKRSRELEDRLNELKLLVQVLEEKYEVNY